MKIQRLLIALTIANFGFLVFLLAQIRPIQVSAAPPVLRGRALEIIDDRGRIRASIKIEPADQLVTMPSGKSYPETVMLRLSDSNGRPAVKLGGSHQGGGIGFVGDTDSTYVVWKAEGTESSLKLTNKDGREQVIKP
ncbi:MAG: hypothetical protein HYX72_09920 [Acidobacteria bacterium]|nr:hypothetical protein [Acidobacteriota bacterium]